MGLVQLGNAWPDLAWTVTDINGVPADATLCKLTITAPDATVPVNAVTVTSTSAGNYGYDYAPTMVGRWVARPVATGNNQSALLPIILNVVDASDAIVSLSDARERLNMTSATSDDELWFYIDSATDYIEGIVGPVVQRTYVETRTPTNGRIPLSHWPVISLTSVVGAWGYAWTSDVTKLHVTDAGILEPNLGSWLPGYPLTVTYVAGLTVVPELIREATLDYVKWAWESQRGPSGAPFQGEEFADQVLPTPPYKIAAKLARYRSPVVA